MYKDGITIRQIAKSLCRNHMTVSAALRAAGFLPRRGTPVGFKSRTGDPIASVPVGCVPADHPLAEVDAAMMRAREWEQQRAIARQRAKRNG
jgi:hypothetical protein